ncbi:hypothetical protein Athai_16040 [Actinocatenispora thailandica]|uniref:Uncharacterized protein n=1 Tax=Actinocatenispora thailandica TaxID=227318 RepID=A0A7R7HVX0_9ACTN|nr:hypothetical protein [Actinocatenispora thailandica]BCJ34101.1 hypothetical protein Athai_16040 [Actinocatenispora thailandica]
MDDEGPLRCAVVSNPAKVDIRQVRADVTRVLDGAGWPAPDWYETTPRSRAPASSNRRYGPAPG